MTLPHVYYTQGDTRVCKPVKSLYGLKQPPRKWNKNMCNSLISFGFQQSANDYSPFVRNKDNYVTVLLVYINDIILTGSNSDELQKSKNILKTQFLIKDLGKIKLFSWD